MLNFPNRKLLFSFALIPFVIASGEISTNAKFPVSTSQHIGESGQIIAQNTFIGWVASFWQRRPTKRLIARSTSGVCAIAPGLVETYNVWSDRPLFLWHSPGNNQDVQLVLRDYESREVVWTQPVNLADQKVVYNAKDSLEPGKLYQWQLSDSTNWTAFQVMSASDRHKIQADLQALEQKLQATKASQEEIAMRKADYFLNYEIRSKNEENIDHLWSDALQTLNNVENPSPSFRKQREAMVADVCTQSSPITQVK